MRAKLLANGRKLDRKKQVGRYPDSRGIGLSPLRRRSICQQKCRASISEMALACFEPISHGQGAATGLLTTYLRRRTAEGNAGSMHLAQRPFL